MPLSQLTEPLGIKRAAHLLRRACFGGTIAEIETFAALTPVQALERLLEPDLPEPGYPIDPLTGQEWITTGNAESEGFELERYLFSWHLAQLIGHGVPPDKKLAYIFRERLVYFLHTHFTTQRSVVGNTRSLYYQLALFRFFALDKEDRVIPGVPVTGEEDEIIEDTIIRKDFKILSNKISVENAMLVFLDGRFNVKGSPNENYAREFLELYSIGKGLEGHVPEPEFIGDYYYFTEQDVQAGAKVLSGFNHDHTFSTIDEDTGLPTGIIKGGNVAQQHDNSTKDFSIRHNNAQVVPDTSLMLGGFPTRESVLDEIRQFIDIIYDHPETARAICRKVYRFFVYHEVSQELQNDIIQDMADVFIANGYKLQPVIEALLTSSHFYEGASGADDNNFGSLIKAPIELMLGFMRNFEIDFPDFETDLASFYEFGNDLLNNSRSQGMNYYEPIDVAGYPGYHQYPVFNRSWITTNYLANRYNYINRAISDGMDMDMGKVDIYTFTKARFPNNVSSNARELIKAIAGYFLPTAENLTFEDGGSGEISVERLNYFLSAFLYSPQIDPDPEAAWTFRWLNGVDDETVTNQLTNLFNAMLQTPEYQLM